MFITQDDYDATIHKEILDAIIRQDATIIPILEDRAIEEMQGYLSARYDIVSIFSATGATRNPIIVQFALDIVIYNAHCIHNPTALPKNREDRYNRVVSWLKGVQRGDINPTGLKLLDDSKGSESHISWNSNKKRHNHY